MNLMAAGFTSSYGSVRNWIERKMLSRGFEEVSLRKCSDFRIELEYVDSYTKDVMQVVEMNRRSFNRWSVIL